MRADARGERLSDMAELGPEAHARLLALNNAHAAETSHLEEDDWARLTGIAFAAVAAGTGGFVIALDEGADYASPNFLWLRARFERFVYVDRVVVGRQMRGQGVARRLYGVLFARAAAAGHRRVVCEVNRAPPNPGSDAFHAALGFAEIGRGTPAPGKLVRYLERLLET